MIKEYFYGYLSQIFDIDPVDIKFGTNGLYISKNNFLILFGKQKNIPSDIEDIYFVIDDEKDIQPYHLNWVLEDHSKEQIKECVLDICDILEVKNIQLKDIDFHKYFLSRLNRFNEKQTNIISNSLNNDFNAELLINYFNSSSIKEMTVEYKDKKITLLNPANSWNLYYDLYILFKVDFDREPSVSEIYKNYDLGKWVSYQRTYYRQGYLKEDKINLLNSKGFIWNTETDMWLQGYNMLVKYKKEFGTTEIPKRNSYKGYNLGLWCNRQRQEYSNSTLSLERINLLKELGFIFDPLEEEWNRRYEQYKRYIEVYKTAHISRRTDFEGEHLGTWVETQRKRYTQKKLSKERIDKLCLLNENFFVD